MSTTTMLADAMPLIVWISGPDGAPSYCNQRWVDYTGITFQGAREEGWKTLVHPDDLQKTIDRWIEASAKGTIYEVEFRFRRASDGAYRWHLGRAFPLRDDAGVIRYRGPEAGAPGTGEPGDGADGGTQLGRVAARPRHPGAPGRSLGLGCGEQFPSLG
jgi:PAS domain S-box-containing protein